MLLEDTLFPDYVEDEPIHTKPLIIDSFAGGGGASLGIERAIGRSPDYAINHDEMALAMHRANHPDTEHLSSNIWLIDPRDVVRGRPVGLLWASPDCTHHSRAKGGKPLNRNIRDLAWNVVVWAMRAKPKVIMLENVVEFEQWGPLDQNDKPIASLKGSTFKAWVKEFKKLGYKVDWKVLRACDYGTPTIRKRLFVVIRRDRKAIVWPKPTHGSPYSFAVLIGLRKPWRTAAEIIDWSLPCPSIFESKEEIWEKYGLKVKRPLVPATMKRIAHGVMRYVVNAAKPFLVVCNHGGDHFRGQSIDEPIQTLTASRDAFGVVAPHITKFRNGAIGHPMDEPLATVTGNGKSKRPAGAVPLGIVAPVLTYAQQGGRNRTIEEPHHTITASSKDQNAIIAPVLTGCGGRAGQSAPRTANAPLGTMTSKPDHVVAAATFLAQHNEGPRPGRQAKAVEEPISTITASGSQQGVVAASLIRHFGNSVGGPVYAPVGTITAGGDGKTGVVAAHMLNMRGTTRRDAGCDDPLNTVSAGGQHAALVATFLDTYYGTEQAPNLDEPMPTETARERRSLVKVLINGITCIITDIGMRMLTPRERFRAQGFPDTYKIETGVLADGSTIKLTQADQGRCCGNSVCPDVAEALVAVNCPELAEFMEAAE